MLGNLKSDGELEATEYLLSGVAFYQDAVEAGRSAVRCHGRRSVYELVYGALASS